MIYARSMALRIAAFGITAPAVAGLVLLLNSLDASPGLAVAAYAAIAVSSGVTIGYFADRLLGQPPKKDWQGEKENFPPSEEPRFA